MRKWTDLLMMTASVLTAASMAAAQTTAATHVRRGPGGPWGPGGPGMPPGPPIERLLDLTSEQREALNTLRQEEHEAVRPLAESMRPLHEALQKLLDEESPDPAAVGEQVLAINRIQKQIKEIHDAHHEKLVALLTDEQKEKLAQFEARMGPRRGPGPPFMPFHGPPPPPR